LEGSWLKHEMKRISPREISLLENFISLPLKRKNVFLLLFVDLEKILDIDIFFNSNWVTPGSSSTVHIHKQYTEQHN